MKLNSLPRRTNRKMPKGRVGRGYGSGSGGHTSGRGTKGQKSRSGHKSMVLFEGGNLPFYRKMPKYPGFKRPFKKEIQTVNISVLEKGYNAKEVVSVVTLREKGLIKKRTENVKILGVGELTKALTIEGVTISESAKEKVLAAKGSVK